MSERKLTVCITFDFDAMSIWIANGRGRTEISRGEFGAVALPRILKVLADLDVPGTFFTPGHTALAYPQLMRMIVDAGRHEVGTHGWVHENAGTLTLSQERIAVGRMIDAIEKTTGTRPIGYRSSGHDFRVETLVEAGFAYDSSCCGSDYTPYYLRVGDEWSLTEPFVFGTPCDVLEVPYLWVLDDFCFFEYVPGWSSRQANPKDVLEIWQAEFDFALENCPGGVYDLTLHPQCIGHGSRLAMLKELIIYMKSHPGVLFETVGDYATRWKSEMPLDTWIAAGTVHSGPRWE